MKSFKLLFSLTLLLAFTGCVEKNYFILEDDTVVVDPNDDTNSGASDNDGDGVTNQQEAIDNTDPDNPCSVNRNSQINAIIPEAWYDLDCDGDGVINLWEVRDHTGLLDPEGPDACSYNPEHQDLSIVTDFWKSFHCDIDGVPNGQEITDGTNERDHCDLVVSNQDTSLDLSYWRNIDCDGDNISNEDEINDGTDPLDPDSYIGAGNKLQHVTYGSRTFYFLNDGALFDRSIDTNSGEVRSSYEYDAQNRLTHVFQYSSSSDGNYDIYFTYNGSDISQINITRATGSTIYDVNYEGLTIHVDEQGVSIPNGLHQRSHTFDTDGKILYSEGYYDTTWNYWFYTKTDYTYDTNGDLTFSAREKQYYYPSTQTYATTANTHDYVRETYNYGHDINIINPIYNAIQAVYVQALLVPEIRFAPWHQELAAFSEHFPTLGSRSTQTLSVSTSNNETYGVNLLQTNQYPRFAYRQSWGTEILIDFFYEE